MGGWAGGWGSYCFGNFGWEGGYDPQFRVGGVGGWVAIGKKNKNIMLANT